MKAVLCLLVAAVAGLVACVHFKNTETRDVAKFVSKDRSIASYDYAISTEPAKDDLSFSELKSILQKNQFSKIEDLLKYLRDNKPNYMSRYALAYNSKSLHGSSKSAPRAIVYGESANFIITFNGDPKHDAYEMLEVVQFNQKTKQFEFREIEFNEKNQLKKPYQISAIDGPRLPRENQGKCLTCHSQRRPIWESYDLWPGVYGADDDFPIANFTKRGKQSVFGPVFGSEVKASWQSFLDGPRKTGRYQYLRELKPSILTQEEVDFGPRPNTDLLILLSKLNAQRIVEDIKKTPGGQELRWPLFFSLQCGHVPSSPAFQKRMNAVVAAADKPILDHLVYRFVEILKENQVNLRAVKGYWSDYTLEAIVNKPFYASDRPADFFYGLFNYLHQTAGYVPSVTIETKLDPTLFGFLTIVHDSLPKAHVEQWPMALYEGVHQYRNGIEYPNELFIGALKDLFPQEEQSLVAQIEQANRNGSAGEACSMISQKMSKSWLETLSVTQEGD